MASDEVLRRIGVIGDVHQEDANLEAVLNFFSEQRLEKILCVGDITDGSGSLARCIDLLEEYDVEVVGGNHERWALEGSFRDLPEAIPTETITDSQRHYLANLPPTRRFMTSSGPLLLCHGIGDNDMAQVRPDDLSFALDRNADLQSLIAEGKFRFVLNGHSHRRMVRHFGSLTMINAGTLHQRFRPCCAIIDVGQAMVNFFDIERDAQIEAAETHSLWGPPSRSSPSEAPLVSHSTS